MQHRLLSKWEKDSIKEFIDDMKTKSYYDENFAMRGAFIYASGLIGDDAVPYTTVVDFIYSELTGRCLARG